MGSAVDTGRHIDQVELDGRLLGDAARAAGMDAEVPTCPGWTVRDLVRHQGEVHSWARRHVAEGLTTMYTGELATWPADDEGLLPWYREGHLALVTTLREADPELACWSFLPGGPTGLRFWARRQAHETAVHRIDAESALGKVTELPAEFAADGIDEMLFGFFARRPSRLVSERPYAIALEPADLARRWLVRVGAEGQTTTVDKADPADCTVSGSAFDLYRLLWNRLSAGELQLSGDPAGLEHWREHAKITW